MDTHLKGLLKKLKHDDTKNIGILIEWLESKMNVDLNSAKNVVNNFDDLYFLDNDRPHKKLVCIFKRFPIYMSFVYVKVFMPKLYYRFVSLCRTLPWGDTRINYLTPDLIRRSEFIGSVIERNTSMAYVLFSFNVSTTISVVPITLARLLEHYVNVYYDWDSAVRPKFRNMYGHAIYKLFNHILPQHKITSEQLSDAYRYLSKICHDPTRSKDMEEYLSSAVEYYYDNYYWEFYKD
jgi:hypothetical protein